MKIIKTSLIILFICSACWEHNETKNSKNIITKPYPHAIDIDKGFTSPAIIKLSSIADSIKYIILSKDKEVIISDFPWLQMTDSEFYINFRGQIYRFDLSGKFLNTIGKIGRGPEEYMPGSPFATNPSADRIYVKRNYMHDYITYSNSGKFIGNISLKKSDNIWEFECFSDSIFMYTFYYIFMVEKSIEDLILCGLFDINGNKIHIIEHPAKNVPSEVNFYRLGISPPSYTFYNYDVVLNHIDTVYKINKDTIIPGFILNWGKIPHRHSFEELYYIQAEPSKKVEKTGKFLEISDKAYFGLKDLDKYFLFEYDKKTGNTRSMLANGEENFGFINDIDGGVKYYPKWTNKAGNIWIDYDDAFKFKKNHDEDLLSNSIAVYPERKDKLKSFLKNLEIGDNPVLKIVYLKPHI